METRQLDAVVMQADIELLVLLVDKMEKRRRREVPSSNACETDAYGLTHHGNQLLQSAREYLAKVQTARGDHQMALPQALECTHGSNMQLDRVDNCMKLANLSEPDPSPPLSPTLSENVLVGVLKRENASLVAKIRRLENEAKRFDDKTAWGGEHLTKRLKNLETQSLNATAEKHRLEKLFAQATSEKNQLDVMYAEVVAEKNRFETQCLTAIAEKKRVEVLCSEAVAEKNCLEADIATERYRVEEMHTTIAHLRARLTETERALLEAKTKPVVKVSPWTRTKRSGTMETSGTDTDDSDSPTGLSMMDLCIEGDAEQSAYNYQDNTKAVKRSTMKGDSQIGGSSLRRRSSIRRRSSLIGVVMDTNSKAAFDTIPLCSRSRCQSDDTKSPFTLLTKTERAQQQTQRASFHISSPHTVTMRDTPKSVSRCRPVEPHSTPSSQQSNQPRPRWRL